MVFDREEWGIRADSEHRIFLGIFDNTVEVVPANPKHPEYNVRIVVPSGLFPFLRYVLKYSREELIAMPPALYLVQGNKTEFFFGYDRGENREDSTVLWRYPSLPAWARNRNGL